MNSVFVACILIVVSCASLAHGNVPLGQCRYKGNVYGYFNSDCQNVQNPYCWQSAGSSGFLGMCNGCYPGKEATYCDCGYTVPYCDGNPASSTFGICTLPPNVTTACNTSADCVYSYNDWQNQTMTVQSYCVSGRCSGNCDPSTFSQGIICPGKPTPAFPFSLTVLAGRTYWCDTVTWTVTQTQPTGVTAAPQPTYYIPTSTTTTESGSTTTSSTSSGVVGDTTSGANPNTTASSTSSATCQRSPFELVMCTAAVSVITLEIVVRLVVEIVQVII